MRFPGSRDRMHHVLLAPPRIPTMPETSTPVASTTDSGFNELLLADLSHFEAALARNEDLGEKRFAFLVTFIAAVLSGLVAVATVDKEGSETLAAALSRLRPSSGPPQFAAAFQALAVTAVSVLLAVSVLTYLRMLQRNAVTDGYKDTLRYVRETYVALASPDAVREYKPVPRPRPRDRSRVFREKWLRAGYAETTGAIVGALYGLLLWLLASSQPLVAVLSGICVATIFWQQAATRPSVRDNDSTSRWSLSGANVLIFGVVVAAIVVSAWLLAGGWTASLTGALVVIEGMMLRGDTMKHVSGLDIESLHHVSLPVTDLERSVAFYREVLGLRQMDRPSFSFDGAWFDVGDRQLHLIVDDAPNASPTFRDGKGVDSRDVHFAVRVRSFREALRHLEALGYERAGKDGATDTAKRMKVNESAAAGFPQVFILDPDRHVIEINAERVD
jgi:catechol 2,3-dioxygenase-like lactoylglutathione lyase family enzyme